MAKRPERKIVDTDLFHKTAPESEQPAGTPDLDEGPTVSTGLGLRTGELNAAQQIADELGISRNALLRWAIRYVLSQYLAGKLDLRKWIEIPPEPKKNIRMP